jgi:hypothetical protein
MSTTTDSNERAYETSPVERDADELTDSELEGVSGGDRIIPKRPR